jgi:hypothetical protein
MSRFALVSISCAAALHRFPLVAGTDIHRDRQLISPFCSFLGLFAPVHAQDEQIRGTAQRVLAAALLQLQHHPHATERIETLRFAQRRKIALKNISWGLQIIRLLWSTDHNSGEFYLIIYSATDYQAQQSLSCHFSHFACPPSHEGCTLPDTFFSLKFIKERILCKLLYAILWRKVENMFLEEVSSILIHQIWIRAPQTLSSTILFPCIFVFLYQNREIISSLTLLNHGKA